MTSWKERRDFNTALSKTVEDVEARQHDTA